MTGGASLPVPDLCLHQTDCQSEVLRDPVHHCLEFILGVGHNCCDISKHYVPDENFAYFVLPLRRATLKSLPFERARMYLQYFAVSKSCFCRAKHTKEGGSMIQA